MNEEEKQAIKECDIIFMCLEDMMSEESANDFRSSYRIMKNLIEKQQKEIEKLKEIIISIRHELKGNIISKKDDGSYGPAKNLTKQEVYKSYLKLICLLKANRVFLEDEDAIKELLNE